MQDEPCEGSRYHRKSAVLEEDRLTSFRRDGKGALMGQHAPLHLDISDRGLLP